eukprot:jgi/Tetstr1/454083/TSEL_041002.t1
MRGFTVVPGSLNRITYTYMERGSMRAVHLVYPMPAAPRPPKRNAGAGTGAGDAAWLRTTPFLTVELSGEDPRERGQRALLGVADGAGVAAVDAGVLRYIGQDHGTVALSERDAETVARAMRVPMVVITGCKGGGGFDAVYRRRDA